MKSKWDLIEIEPGDTFNFKFNVSITFDHRCAFIKFLVLKHCKAIIKAYLESLFDDVYK